MKPFFSALFVLLALSGNSLAGEIRKGATMQVKSNSIWFDDAVQLTRWQQFNKSGNAAALASYQDKMLASRDAWQFTNELTVKILRYLPRVNQVKVEMKTPGRLQDSTWMLDAGALVQ